ncbi:MAG TPA: IMP dehydrogenase [Candidatus Limnocylindrales bacterium]
MTTEIGKAGTGEVAGAFLNQPLLGLTFDDVLLIPQYSEILPGDASVATRFSRHILLNTPVVSAAMDTVTEDGMAIAMAIEGGIGVVHRNQTPENQAEQVAAVKAASVPAEATLASLDGRGRLRVAAAVGVGTDSIARAEALVRAGVDALVVDTAHGHTRNVIDALRRYRDSYGIAIDLVAGNVATPEGTAALIEAGADGVKVGIGPGSICTTRIVAGVGVPQLTAIMMCAAVAHQHDVPIIGDGGIRYSGDIVKALAAGADTIMLGRLLAVAEESPGEAERVGGRVVKEYRGMGSLGAMSAGSDRYPQVDRRKLVPEGVEALVAVAGPLAGILYQLIGGTKAGMTYCGAESIADLRLKARFVQLTHSGQIESHPHDIEMARSAPNYP